MSGDDEDLGALRDEVTRLTLEIIRLSGERLALVKRIGEIKAQRNMPIEDIVVERKLKSKVIDISEKYGIDINFSLRLLDFLIEEAKRVQRDLVKSRFHI